MMDWDKWNSIYVSIMKNPMKRATCTTKNKQFAESGKTKGGKDTSYILEIYCSMPY